jgi:hypothetical protein
MAPPLPLASAPQQHPGVMPPPVQPLAMAAQDHLNLMAPPFRQWPRLPPLLLPVEMPPPCPVFIEQDELHDLKWSVLLWLSQGGPTRVYHGGMWVCRFCQRGHKQWTICDLFLHTHNIIVSPTWIWDARARHRASEEYQIQETRFAALCVTAGFL